jgi:helicase
MNCNEELLKLFGYKSLYPAQELAISKGLLDGKNILVTTPTSSGKTLIGLMATFNVLLQGKKIVYLSPLRALAQEKFNDFSVFKTVEATAKLGRKVKIKISTGDYDSNGANLRDADIIILTNEKMDSIIRHGGNWLKKVGLFIIDEIHLITERERGPTLEMIITKIKNMYHQAQIIALSATISNSDEISGWLGCELVESNWRPVPLSEGVYDYGKVRMNDGTTFSVDFNISSASINLAMQSVKDGGQAIIFAETRRRAISLAVKASNELPKLINFDTNGAKKISDQILKENPEINKMLGSAISKGVAYHHAGLNGKTREIIEHGFRSGDLKILTATPTLSMGVNLPARRVIIASIFRYDFEYGGSMPLSILEYKQLCGRAGRPKFDKYGEAIIIADSRIDSYELYDHYVLGTSEPIRSQLINEKALRFHLLGIIATSAHITKAKIYDILNKTFLATHVESDYIQSKIDQILEYLIDGDLIKFERNFYVASKFGKRISLLYIDPYTAIQFKKDLESHQKMSDHAIEFLKYICDASDFYPKLALRSSDMKQIIQYPNSSFLDSSILFEISSSRSLLGLLYWIEEASESMLNEKIGIEPGDLYRMTESANWLSYSLYEIAKLLGRTDLLKEIYLFRQRIRYGIKEELIPIIQLEDIGRIRARSLHNAGLINLQKILEIPENKLAQVPKIGAKLAKQIKNQINSYNNAN